MLYRPEREQDEDLSKELSNGAKKNKEEQDNKQTFSKLSAENISKKRRVSHIGKHCTITEKNKPEKTNPTEKTPEPTRKSVRNRQSILAGTLGNPVPINAIEIQ